MRILSNAEVLWVLVTGLLGCSGPAENPQSSGGATANPTGGATAGGNVGLSSSAPPSPGGTSNVGGVTASGTTTTTGGSIPPAGGGSGTGGSAIGGSATGAMSAGGTTASGGSAITTTGTPTTTMGGNSSGGTRSDNAGGSGGKSPTGGANGKGGTSHGTGANGNAAGSTSGNAGGNSSSATGGATVGTGGSKPTCSSAATLKEAGTCSGRLIGTALTTKHLQDSAYSSNALEFNYVTPEDEMKWDATEPTRNQFTFGQGDQIVEFAAKNGMKVKGHTLVWYNQLPAWVSAISSATDLRAAMVSHIQGVMQHYKGKVIAWDVVNEAWDDTDSTVLRDSVFSRVLGASYIDDAFKAARAADAGAKLFYNDYATDGLSTKANSVYAMVKDLKARGIPIDGVGLQMHWRSVGSSLTAADVIANMQRIIDLGLEVVISEMDVQLCKGGTLNDQQARFHDIVAACLTLPKCTAVTFWGITDKYSWLNSRTDLGCSGSEAPRPLLWDDSYAKKPAYTGVMEALLGR